MGIHCEINICKPPNGAFVGISGNVILGTIKYAVDCPTTISAITVSVKGSGTLKIEDLQRKNSNGYPETEECTEDYIDVDIVTQNHEKKSILEVGAYEIPFRIVIPHNIPPSLEYKYYGNFTNIKCKISYYIRVKFSKPGMMSRAKRFRKDIIIISAIVPRLPISPVCYEDTKKLTQFFSSKDKSVEVKVHIFKSVLECGEKIELNYEVANNTNVVIKAIKVKIVEIYTFKSFSGQKIVKQENVPGTDTKTVAIQSGQTQEMSVEITMPSDRESLEFSKLVSREYFVFIGVKLPIPHRNYELKIPLQIGHTLTDSIGETEDCLNDQPPSYWEAMYEDIEK